MDAHLSLIFVSQAANVVLASTQTYGLALASPASWRVGIEVQSLDLGLQWHVAAEVNLAAAAV